MTESRTASEAEPLPVQFDQLTPPWGEQAVFAVFPLIQQYVYYRLGQQEGEDVFSTVLEVILRDIHKVTATTPLGFKSWCYGVAHNKVMDALRSKFQDRFQAMDPEELVQIADPAIPSTQEARDASEVLAYILGLLRASKPPCVDLLIEHVLLDVEIPVMAAKYGIESDAMRMRITRCLELARKLAKKHL